MNGNNVMSTIIFIFVKLGPGGILMCSAKLLAVIRWSNF